MGCWSEIITGLAIVVVAIIETLAAKDRKHAKIDREKMNKRAECRAEESRLAMELMNANVSLSVATAIAIECGKTNGEMKKAKNEAEKSQNDYNKFVKRIASEQVTKY